MEKTLSIGRCEWLWAIALCPNESFPITHTYFFKRLNNICYR